MAYYIYNYILYYILYIYIYIYIYITGILHELVLVSDWLLADLLLAIYLFIMDWQCICLIPKAWENSSGLKFHKCRL